MALWELVPCGKGYNGYLGNTYAYHRLSKNGQLIELNGDSARLYTELYEYALSHMGEQDTYREPHMKKPCTIAQMREWRKEQDEYFARQR